MDFGQDALIFVECKRYDSSRKIHLGLVRSLYGVISDGPKAATAAMLATTFSFTKLAMDYAGPRAHRLIMRDLTGIAEWLAKTKGANRGP